eukprot:gene9473-6650_t
MKARKALMEKYRELKTNDYDATLQKRGELNQLAMKMQSESLLSTLQHDYEKVSQDIVQTREAAVRYDQAISKAKRADETVSEDVSCRRTKSGFSLHRGAGEEVYEAVKKMVVEANLPLSRRCKMEKGVNETTGSNVLHGPSLDYLRGVSLRSSKITSYFIDDLFAFQKRWLDDLQLIFLITYVPPKMGSPIDITALTTNARHEVSRIDSISLFPIDEYYSTAAIMDLSLWSEGLFCGKDAFLIPRLSDWCSGSEPFLRFESNLLACGLLHAVSQGNHHIVFKGQLQRVNQLLYASPGVLPLTLLTTSTSTDIDDTAAISMLCPYVAHHHALDASVNISLRHPVLTTANGFLRFSPLSNYCRDGCLSCLSLLASSLVSHAVTTFVSTQENQQRLRSCFSRILRITLVHQKG